MALAIGGVLRPLPTLKLAAGTRKKRVLEKLKNQGVSTSEKMGKRRQNLHVLPITISGRAERQLLNKTINIAQSHDIKRSTRLRLQLPCFSLPPSWSSSQGPRPWIGDSSQGGLWENTPWGKENLKLNEADAQSFFFDKRCMRPKDQAECPRLGSPLYREYHKTQNKAKALHVTSKTFHMLCPLVK